VSRARRSLTAFKVLLSLAPELLRGIKHKRR